MTTLSAQFCTPAEQKASALDNAPIHCLTRNESIALAFVAEAGVLSMVAAIVAFALIFRNVVYHIRYSSGKWRLIKVPMDIYLLSLFAADFVQSIAEVINAKWVQDGKLHIGGLCSVQAVTLSIGPTMVAISSLAIAAHTFVTVWLDKGFDANFVAWVVVAIGWIYSIVYVAVVGALHPHEPNSIFRPTPYWCWVGKHYLTERLLAVYISLWLALIASALLYLPLFFWSRGNITVGDKGWNFRIHKRQNVVDPQGSRRRSLSMIAYPLVYAVLVLPLSVARWIGFHQERSGDRKIHVPPSATIAAQFVFALSGVSNVLLFLFTRPNLLLFGTSGLDTLRNGSEMSIPEGGEIGPDDESIELPGQNARVRGA